MTTHNGDKPTMCTDGTEARYSAPLFGVGDIVSAVDTEGIAVPLFAAMVIGVSPGNIETEHEYIIQWQQPVNSSLVKRTVPGVLQHRLQVCSRFFQLPCNLDTNVPKSDVLVNEPKSIASQAATIIMSVPPISNLTQSMEYATEERPSKCRLIEKS